MNSVVVVTALGVWLLGALIDMGWAARRPWARRAPYVAGIAGGVLVAVLGVHDVLNGPQVVSLGTTTGVGQSSLRFDQLSGLFLTLVGSLAVLISACLLSWTRPAERVQGRGTGSGYLLLLGSVTLILVAGDAFSFLFGWEGLTASFYILAALGRRDRTEARASWVTLGVGKVSGAALLVGFLLLAGKAGNLTLASWSHVPGGAVHDAAWVLIVVGFGAKVGLMPFQVWLPVGYPAAPGPVRAAMAGLAVNVGFYGLWRMLGILGRPPLALAVVVLVVGGLTALVGIVFAGVQSGLDRVIAYSSVENAGIILVGYGIALAGATAGNRGLIGIGLLAASLQILAHAVAKSGLFASAAFFEADYETDQLDELRGVGYRHRTSGITFSVASLTLAGLPPTIGFVSEWFVLEALMQEFRLPGLALRLAMALAGALVALTAGVAALTFIRLVGLTILGRVEPSVSIRGLRRPDDGAAGWAGLVLLAASCLAPALAAPWVLRYIADGLVPIVPRATIVGALRSPWVLQPVYGSFSAMSSPWLFVTMPIGFAAVAGMTLVLSRGRLLKVRRVPAWRSATVGVSGPDRYSSFGYANVLRHVLGNVLGTRREAVVATDEPDAFPHDTPLLVRSVVVEPMETYLYGPGRRALLWTAARATRLQSGRLDAYVAYMLGALLVLLALVAIIK